MAERPPKDPPPPEAHPLNARELQLAILYAHGMSITAIDRCVGLAEGVVETYLIYAYRKMTASVKGSPPPTLRSEMREWLSERGLLGDRSESEAVLERAMSALESVADPRLEEHVKEEMAVLEAARRGLREPFARAMSAFESRRFSRHP